MPRIYLLFSLSSRDRAARVACAVVATVAPLRSTVGRSRNGRAPVALPCATRHAPHACATCAAGSEEPKRRRSFCGFKVPVVINYNAGGKAGSAEACHSELVFPFFPSFPAAVPISFGFWFFCLKSLSRALCICCPQRNSFRSSLTLLEHSEGLSLVGKELRFTRTHRLSRACGAAER